MPDKTTKALAAIARKIGEGGVQTASELLTCYAFDATNVRSRPAAVTFPRSTDEVRDIVGLCHRWGLAVIPRGAGTGFAV